MILAITAALMQVATAINLNFYAQSNCDIVYGYSCVDVGNNVCCAATYSGKVRWASVQASDYPKRAWDGYKLGVIAYQRIDGLDCGKAAGQVEHDDDGKSDTSECVRGIHSLAGAASYYKPAKSVVDQDKMSTASSASLEIMPVSHVFYRDNDFMYYMDVKNETRMARWQELVQTRDKLSILNFMLAGHDMKSQP